MSLKRFIAHHAKRPDWWFLLAICGLALAVLLAIGLY
jgi:hypothetical protein